MHNIPEHIDILIARVLSGEADASALEELQQWRSEDPRHEQYFREQEKIMAVFSVPHSFDTKAAWIKMERRMNAEPRIVSLQQKYKFAAAAAVVIVALAALLVWLYRPAEPTGIMMASNDQVLQKDLPDGSKVVLAERTELSYEVKKGLRLVKLKGEASFVVEHKADETFIVQVFDSVFVQDIGTAFNVKAIPGSEKVEVIVTEGAVRCYTGNKEGLQLRKGQSAVYERSSGVFTRIEQPSVKQGLPYKSKRFDFYNERLSDVLEMIRAAYQVDIRLANPKLSNCRLSVSFNDEELDVILEVIEETLGIKAVARDSVITLNGKACDE